MGFEQCTSFGANAINSIQNQLKLPSFSPNFAINYLLNEKTKGNNMIKKYDSGVINLKYGVHK